MSTESASEITQTLRLLDCVDAVRHPTPPAQETPASVKVHLIGVCQRLGQPVSEQEANQAVALYLDKDARATVPIVHLLKDRPADEAAWKATRETEERTLARLTRSVDRWEKGLKALGLGLIGAQMVGAMVGIIAGIMFLISLCPTTSDFPHAPWGWMALGCGGLAGIAEMFNAARLRRWWDRMDDRRVAQHNRCFGLRPVTPRGRPEAEDLTHWAKYPGVPAAYYQILTSGVPWLEQDTQAIRAHVKNQLAEKQQRQEQAQRQREDQAWVDRFEQIARTHLPAVQ